MGNALQERHVLEGGLNVRPVRWGVELGENRGRGKKEILERGDFGNEVTSIKTKGKKLKKQKVKKKI